MLKFDKFGETKRFNLIKNIALTDFRLRYSNSILGYFWSLLKPLLMFGILYIVFSKIFKINMPHYALYLLFGIILWTFFAEATSDGMRSIISKAGLIKKLNFARSSLVISSNFTAVLTLLTNLVVFAAFFLFEKATLTYTALILPIFFIELLMLSLGTSFLLSALFVKFRDLSYIWEVLLQLGFWITPIVYAVSMVPERLSLILHLNPVARIIIGARDALLFNIIPSLRYQLITLAMVLLILALGYIIFKRIEPKFAEEI